MTVALSPSLLLCDSNAFIKCSSVVRANLRANAVFERRDNLSAGRIVFWICTKHKGHIQVQSDRVTLNLHVTFLHDIEERNLNFPRQIWKFVDGEDAAI